MGHRDATLRGPQLGHRRDPLEKMRRLGISLPIKKLKGFIHHAACQGILVMTSLIDEQVDIKKLKRLGMK